MHPVTSACLWRNTASRDLLRRHFDEPASLWFWPLQNETSLVCRALFPPPLGSQFNIREQGLPGDVAPVHAAGSAYMGRMSNLHGSSIRNIAASGFSQVIILCSSENVRVFYSQSVLACSEPDFKVSFMPSRWHTRSRKRPALPLWAQITSCSCVLPVSFEFPNVS